MSAYSNSHPFNVLGDPRSHFSPAIEPCSCKGWEFMTCKKLCECAPEYPGAAGAMEYASWFPISPAGVEGPQHG